MFSLCDNSQADVFFETLSAAPKALDDLINVVF